MDKKRSFAAALLLALATAGVYWPAGTNQFLLYDDAHYILLNQSVRDGLTPAGLRWAFTSFYAYNWHPLTWLSHMLDSSLFGVLPRGPHLVNVLLHAANAALLLVVLGSMTGALAASALVAASFALHPLHVQSVAWLAERKDLLAAFFWLLTMGAWLRYARRPRPGRYLAAAVCLLLGLLSKPMVVTLPVVLLMLDLWPLGRVQPGRQGRGAPWRRLLLEKLPLLALAAGAGWLTYLAQSGGGTVVRGLPLPTRLANALVSYATYIGKALWPSSLAIFYPYPDERYSAAQLLGALVLLTLATSAAVWWFRRCPWYSLGWGWFTVTLLPVIGLIQVGRQAMADRYTYLPLTGLFVAAAWGGAKAVTAHPRTKAAAGIAGVLLLIAWTAVTRTQLGYWKDGVALFSHSLAVTRDNAEARYNLGRSYLQENQVPEALSNLERAVALDPHDARFLNDLGMALARARRRQEAVGMFRRAISLEEDYADPYLNLAMLELARNDRAAAQSVYESLRRVSPENARQLERFFPPSPRP
jgi:tetratricopeptide (TPR) repeat protein